MEIKIDSRLHYPFHNSILGADQEIYEKVAQSKHVTVNVDRHGKTALSIDFNEQLSDLSANLIPPGSEHYKFRPDKKIWYKQTVAGQKYTTMYFSVTKTQGRYQIETHIQNLLRLAFGNLGIDTLTVTLNISPAVCWK